MNALRAAVLGGLVLLGACAAPSGPEPAPEAIPVSVGDDSIRPFCPDCSEFPQVLGVHGGCPHCAKPMLELNISSTHWYACAPLRSWRAEPCGREPQIVRAWILPAGTPGVFELRYCPKCRTFAGVEERPEELRLCPGCDLEPILTPALMKSWAWCVREFRWLDEPCPWNEKESCCTLRSVLLPVTLREEVLPAFPAAQEPGSK
ncbi:MAG: hypothetical protein HY293_21290 [Planctomycetes bacterium]|nr:hypothetical protein [Planctomycetota bacterium]